MNVDESWQSLIRPSGEGTFDPRMVEDIPEPARRYLLHSIAPGTPLSTCVEFEMEGRFRASAKASWMPMRASEVISVPGGFVWKAVAGGLISIRGYDRCVDGEAEMRWKLWGLIPMLKASGPDISRSARGRFLMEAAAWMPALLLPQNGTQWERVDEDTAKATVSFDGEPAVITFSIDTGGTLRKMLYDRWGNVLTGDGGYQHIPFASVVRGEASFGGYTVPTKVAAGWWADTDRYHEFFDAEITRVHYR